MTVGRIAALALGSAGALALAGSLSWWWLSYGEVYRYDYLSLSQAGLCLVGESEICRLAASLCRGQHTGLVAPYSSTTLWLALASLCASLMVPGRAVRPAVGSRPGETAPRPSNQQESRP